MASEQESNVKLKEAGIAFTRTMSNDVPPKGFSAGSHSWKVQLRYKGRTLTVPYFTGSMAGEPTAAGVLSSLVSDSSADGMSFEEWASDFGYNTDSREAEKTYKSCVRNAKKLHALLKSDYTKITALVEGI